MAKLVLFLILILISGLTAQAQDVDEGLKNFLRYSLLGFPDWVKAEGLDPVLGLSKAVPIDIETDIFTLHGTLSETYLTGLSSEISSFDDKSTFINSRIDLTIEINSAGLSGMYNATGMVFETYPIGGQNSWNLGSDPLYVGFYQNFYVENGYIVLNDSDTWKYDVEFLFLPITLSGTFNEMFDADTVAYEASIVKEIAGMLPGDVYGSSGADVQMFTGIISRYLQICFSKTPVSDIITWPETTTPPPVRTTEASSTTEVVNPTIGYTTEAPCINSGGTGIKNEALNNFIFLILSEYPEYLRKNGLDPTAPIIEPVSLLINSSFLELTATFRESIGAGMSTAEVDPDYVTSEFGKPSFRFEMELRGVKLYGKYEASGRVISMYPLEGAGDWELLDINTEIDFEIEGFAIVNGYIDLTQYNYRDMNAKHELAGGEGSTIGISFPDLVTPDSADGLGSEVLVILAEAVPSNFAEKEKHPILKSLLDYLIFRFSNTPLTEIIATTSPPCLA